MKSRPSTPETTAAVRAASSELPPTIAVPSCAPLEKGITADEADSGQRKPERCRKDDHRDRRRKAKSNIVEQVGERERRNRFGGAPRTAAGHDVDEIKDPQRIEAAEENRNRHRRAEERQRDIGKSAPRSSA